MCAGVVTLNKLGNIGTRVKIGKGGVVGKIIQIM